MTNMTSERAVAILTPGATRYSPEEYEQALELARNALTWRSFDEAMPCEGEEFLCTDGRYIWLDQIVCGERDGETTYYLDSGNDMDRAWWKPRPLLPERREEATT